MRTCIEPSKTTSQKLHLQVLLVEELLIHSGDFQLSTRGRLDVLRHFHHLVGIEVETHHRIVALGLLGLLLNRKAVALLVELSHTIALWVLYPIAKHARLAHLGIFHTFLQHAREATTVEDVVAQHEANIILTHELLANDERLCQPIG